MIEIIFGAIAANAIVIATLGFLARTIIKHFLSKDIERFKSNLESEAKSEIESYRSNLEKERIRLQISYSGIFEKQASVIIEMYNLILDFENKIWSVMTPIADRSELYGAFIESYRALLTYYQINRILLPKTLEDDFESFLKKMYLAVNKHKRAEDQLNRGYMLQEADFDKLFQQQDQANEIIDKLPAYRRDLTDKLRSLIGVGLE
ncbi:MAG: hypothetical protein PHP95_15140 [Desulfuromonadaceae bacterium]|nr:hypothetical protein [Desulfuromonadaceae bacterium]MDD2849785.1 hypothetical protein [Desulfuromonadaceae bacterium]MDD4129359.1 hypothetical protein [Desulfuromonadaceae bacterium]